MNMILIALSAIGGLLLLYFGAEYLVRGGSAIAARSRISPLVIGLTLVAFGTSAPELFVSACAALRGLGDVCVGNIVGSNICNIALIVGSRMLLGGAVAIEKRFGVPDEFVALTVIAVGTSLPELATSVIAARDGEADIALGNIIGSNIFNILGILGLSALLRPVTITGLSAVDFGMMIATAMLLWPLLGARGRLARAEGVILLLVYAGYLIWLVNSM